MCRQALVAILAAAAWAGPAAAQTAAEYRARLDRFEVLWQEAAVAAERAERERRAATPVDTLRAGSLAVVAAPSVAPVADRALQLAWPDLARFYGEEARALETHPIILTIQGQQEQMGPPGPAALPLTAPAGEDEVMLASRLVSAAASFLWGRVDPALGTWLGSGVAVTPDSETAVRREQRYVELVAAPWVATRECFGGELAGCRKAFAVVASADPVREWYAATDFPTLVLGLEDRLRRGEWLQAYDACVTGQSPPSCEAVLATLPPEEVPPPLSPWARLSLTRYALQRSGSGAYGRLVSGAGRAVAQRLEAAAGLPLDSVLAGWRAGILAARPDPVTLPAARAWAAVLWVTVFAVLALRSTRWR